MKPAVIGGIIATPPMLMRLILTPQAWQLAGIGIKVGGGLGGTVITPPAQATSQPVALSLKKVYLTSTLQGMLLMIW